MTGLKKRSIASGYDKRTGQLFQCAFEAYFRTVVIPSMKGVCSNRHGDFDHCGMDRTMYRPPVDVAENAAPTSVPRGMPDDGRILTGIVEDGNSAVMGGIAGHAGIFSNAADLANYAFSWLRPDSVNFLNTSTIELFSRVDHDAGVGASSRALGWNTNDPSAFDYGWNLSCGTLSAKTFTHIGYTGTQICIDPERQIYTILLTNRVFPKDEKNNGIHELRKKFNEAVVKVIDKI